jgi:hypothetical protein
MVQQQAFVIEATRLVPYLQDLRSPAADFCYLELPHRIVFDRWAGDLAEAHGLGELLQAGRLFGEEGELALRLRGDGRYRCIWTVEGAAAPKLPDGCEVARRQTDEAEARDRSIALWGEEHGGRYFAARVDWHDYPLPELGGPPPERMGLLVRDYRTPDGSLWASRWVRPVAFTAAPAGLTAVSGEEAP